MASLTRTDTSSRSHESHTMSFFSSPFSNQKSWVDQGPVQALFPLCSLSGMTEQCVLVSLEFILLIWLFIHVTLHCDHLFICMSCPHLQPDSIILTAGNTSYVFATKKQKKTECWKTCVTKAVGYDYIHIIYIGYITDILSPLVFSFLNL